MVPPVSSVPSQGRQPPEPGFDPQAETRGHSPQLLGTRNTLGSRGGDGITLENLDKVSHGIVIAQARGITVLGAKVPGSSDPTTNYLWRP